ncbi:EXS family protein/ERD1/XPR1/SYG1 family protein [Scleroderma citrinum]
MVIGHDSHPDMSSDNSDHEDPTAKTTMDEGILGPVIVVGRGSCQDTTTEVSNCEKSNAITSTDDGNLGPVIIIGRDFPQDTSTEVSDNETPTPTIEAISENATIPTDIPCFPTSAFASTALVHDEVAFATTSLGRRNERPISPMVKPAGIDSISPRPTSFGATIFSRNSSILPFFSDRGSMALPSLHQLVQQLSFTERQFFKLLDHNLDKVDRFYQEREKEMCERWNRLRKQLDELVAHRQRIYETPAPTNSSVLTRKGRFTRVYARKSTDLGAAKCASESGRVGQTALRHALSVFRSNSTGKQSADASKMTFDPREYQHAKKKLKKAVIECYRGLEVLNNYRILNLVGFRKALKKFERVTKLPAVAIYMSEKVEPSAFASGALVNDILKEMQELYAARFARGDRRIAMKRLRLDASAKSHHFSAFRSGIYLGIALTALAAGIYQCSQANTRNILASWKVLLFIYSILGMPALLTLLIGININVWARERINYPFIFELDLKRKIDPRQYFEIPSLTTCVLACTFCLSFSRFGHPLVWPLVWLGFVVVLLFNPISSFMSGSSRWWAIKNVAKLTLSGAFTVDFTGFWLGDQLCSLSFTFDNLYFFTCVYANYFPSISTRNSTSTGNYHKSSSAYDPQIQEAWQTCSGPQVWGIHYCLAILPFLVRFLHCIRRYWDTRSPPNILNAGKYFTGMIYSLLYHYWSHNNAPRYGSSFSLFCFSACLYSLYACAWDFLVDWSLFNPRSRYPLLRPNLIYTSRIPSYYFAIITNFCIRFIWIIYIPTKGPSSVLRSVFAALLEVLRRIQWNFFRVENEHLGNMDQYRVMREVPLPYSIDPLPDMYDDDDDDDGGGI